MRNSVVVVCFALLFSSSAYADDAAALQSVIGMDMAQLQHCNSDGDCTLVEDFRDCCTWLAVNMNDRDLIADHHNELFQKFASPEKQKTCAEADCSLPPAKASCVQNQCVVK